MNPVSDEDLIAYAQEALEASLSASIEQRLREEEPLRLRLQQLLHNHDQGTMTISEIWRHEQLSCPSRSDWGLYVMQAIESQYADYMQFHLKTVGCIYCQATYDELRQLAEQYDQQDSSAARRERLFESSAIFLNSRTANE